MPGDNDDDLHDRSSENNERETGVPLGEVDREIHVDQCRCGHRETEPTEERRRVPIIPTERPHEELLGNQRQYDRGGNPDQEGGRRARQQDFLRRQSGGDTARGFR